MSNRGGAVIVFVVIIAAALMFSIPLLAMSEKTYDSARESIDSATEKLVNKVTRTGKFTTEDYDSYIKEIEATGNTLDVQIEIEELSGNAAKKTSKADGTVQSTDNYTIYYTTQILDYLNANNGVYELEPGDKFTVKAETTNRTIKEVLSGRTSKIESSSSGVIGK